MVWKRFLVKKSVGFIEKSTRIVRVFLKEKFRVDKMIFIVNNKGTAVADSDSGPGAAVCRQS